MIESRNILIFSLVLMTLAGLALTLGTNSLAVADGPEPAGWYAGDMHVHRSCGGSGSSIGPLRYDECPGFGGYVPAGGYGERRGAKPGD